MHVWLPCTPQPLYTELSVFPGKVIQHAVIPVISFTWSSSTPSTNKMSTFTESFEDAIDSVAMETNFPGYIPIWTSIPPISYNYSSNMWYHINMSTKFGHRHARLVCWSLTSLCHSNGHIETMPAREINPFTALTRIRSQFLRTQWSTSNHQRVDTTTPQTAEPSGLAPSCSYQGNNCGYGEVGAQSAIQYKVVGTALMGQKTHDFLQWFTPKHTPHQPTYNFIMYKKR